MLFPCPQYWFVGDSRRTAGVARRRIPAGENSYVIIRPDVNALKSDKFGKPQSKDKFFFFCSTSIHIPLWSETTVRLARTNAKLNEAKLKTRERKVLHDVISQVLLLNNIRKKDTQSETKLYGRRKI